MIAMIDFIRRVKNRISSIAIDVSDMFYRDLLKDYLEKENWPFTGVREVILYNGMHPRQSLTLHPSLGAFALRRVNFT